MTTAPNELELLLWCYVHEGQPLTSHPAFTAGTAATTTFMEVLGRFQAQAIVEVPAGNLKLLDRGRAWLSMILETPMPVVSWIDPRGLAAPAAPPAVALQVQQPPKIDRPAPSAAPPAVVTPPPTETPAPAAPMREGATIDPLLLERAKNPSPEVPAKPVEIPEGMLLNDGNTRAGPPKGVRLEDGNTLDVPGNQFVTVLRRNGKFEQKFAASVNWRADKNKRDDVIAFAYAEEPEQHRSAHVGNSPKSKG